MWCDPVTWKSGTAQIPHCCCGRSERVGAPILGARISFSIAIGSSTNRIWSQMFLWVWTTPCGCCRTHVRKFMHSLTVWVGSHSVPIRGGIFFWVVVHGVKKPRTVERVREEGQRIELMAIGVGSDQSRRWLRTFGLPVVPLVYMIEMGASGSCPPRYWISFDEAKSRSMSLSLATSGCGVTGEHRTETALTLRASSVGIACRNLSSSQKRTLHSESRSA